jgi:gas vesicle protein
MFHREESNHDFAFMAGVILGAIAGALLALAFTPFSGADARAKVRERTGDMDAMKDRAASIASTAKERVEPVRGKASEVASNAMHKVEPMRDRAMEIAAKSPLPVGNSTKEQLEATVDDVIDEADGLARDAASGNDVVAN